MVGVSNFRHAQYDAQGVGIDDPQTKFASVGQDPTTGALVGAGLRSSVLPAKVVGIQTTPLGAFGQFPDGKYLTYDVWQGPTFGVGSARLAIYNGDLAAGVNTANLTQMSQTHTEAVNALLKPDGTPIDYAAAFINHAWIAPNGDVLFMVTETGNRQFLFRAKAGTYTVGSDAGYTNKRAVLSIGLEGGVQADSVRIFARQNLLFARVGSATHIYFAEYNVASGRVSGTGGAGKDQVICWKSTDAGTTWTEFLKFNTSGTHITDHFHAVLQCPYSGLIYFLLGDTGAECATIVYDGTSAAPALNSTFAQIHATPGWRVLSGSELHRYTDLCFGPQTVFGIPDADTETADTSSSAYVSTVMPKMLEYVSSVFPVERVDNVPPATNLMTSGRAALCLAFNSSLATAAGNNFVDLWNAESEGGEWTRIARLWNQRVGGAGACKSFFEDQSGRVWLGCPAYVGGFSFDPSHNNNRQSSMAILTLARRDGPVTPVDWPV